MPDVHLVCRPAAGGIKTHITGLMTDLPSSGWQPILHGPITLIADFDWARYSELDIAPSISPTDLHTASQLAGRIPVNAIVHAHGIRAAWICTIASLFRNFKLVTTLHNVPPQNIAGRVALKLISKRTSMFICVSQEIAVNLIHDRKTVIPNGVNLSPPVATSRDAVRTTLNVPAATYLVGCVSRLSHEKGVDLLVAAARLLPDLVFVIAGDGPENNVLRGSAPGNVRFLGHRSDVPELLRAFDCAVFPSRSEGQGIGILEAFAAGTPVIAANVGGIPESVVHGKTGLLISPESPEAIAAAIQALRQDSSHAAALSHEAATWVREYRDQPTQSAKIAAIYKRLE